MRRKHFYTYLQKHGVGWHPSPPDLHVAQSSHSQVERFLFTQNPFQNLLKALYRSRPMPEKEGRIGEAKETHTMPSWSPVWRLGRRGNTALGYLMCSAELLFMGPGEMWLQWSQTTKELVEESRCRGQIVSGRMGIHCRIHQIHWWAPWPVPQGQILASSCVHTCAWDG